MSVTRDEAVQIAERFLDRSIRPHVPDGVVVGSVVELSACWGVGYNSAVFLATRAVSHALAGAPLLVDKLTGCVRFGDSAVSIEQQICGEEGPARPGTV